MCVDVEGTGNMITFESLSLSCNVLDWAQPCHPIIYVNPLECVLVDVAPVGGRYRAPPYPER